MVVKNLNLVVYIILICILVYLVFNKKQNNPDLAYSLNQFTSDNCVYLVIAIILFILFCFCTYQSVEGLNNVEEEKYDIDDYETTTLKIMNNLSGNIKNQLVEEIPVGFIYLTTNPNFDANKYFTGKWESIGDDTYGNSFIMVANDGDSNVDYDSNKNRNCAYKKGVDDKCLKNKTSFDLIPNIGYKELFGETVRYTGGENATRLTKDNVPPHNQYLRGGWSGNDPSQCYARVKFGFCIDYKDQVGNSNAVNKTGPAYKRINRETEKPMTSIKQYNDLITDQTYKIPENENKFTTQVGDKVATHNNQPPYVNVYAWRKLSN